MRRRMYLAGLGAGGFAGCLGGGGPPGTSPGSYRLTVDSVTTQSFSLRLNDLGDDVGPPSPALDELDADAREVVETGLDGKYETDEPAPWLRSFVAETPYVEVDESFHSIEHSLPVHVVTAEPVDPDDVDGKIASQDAYEEAVTLDHVVFSGFMRIARDEGYRTVDFHPQLQAFVEAYEAVEYRDETLRIEYDVEDPEPPYHVWVGPAADSEVHDGPVIDVTDMDGEHREPVRAAAATTGIYGVDDPPEGLAEVIENHKYVTIDGTYYIAYANDSSAVDVAFDATLPDETASPDSPAELTLVLRNTGDETLGVTSGAPGPFGIQYMHPRGDPATRVLLWTDDYEESGHVQTDGRAVVGHTDVGIRTDVAPGEAARQTFEIASADLATGAYELADSIGVGESRGGGPLPYSVGITVERTGE